MNFSGFPDLFSAVIVLVLLVFVSIRIFTSRRKLLIKAILFLVALFFTLPLWMIFSQLSASVSAILFPQRKFVNCIYLNRENCDKRPDCEYIPERICSPEACKSYCRYR